MDSALEKLSRSLEIPTNDSTTSKVQATQRHQACILTLLRVLDNILSDPQRHNAKTRKIKVDNAVFWKRAGKWDGSIDFLAACGFSSIGYASHLGHGTPQYLKFESEDNLRRDHLLHGRECLVRFAVESLGIDGKFLPQLPSQSPERHLMDEKLKVSEKTTQSTAVDNGNESSAATSAKPTALQGHGTQDTGFTLLEPIACLPKPSSHINNLPLVGQSSIEINAINTSEIAAENNDNFGNLETTNVVSNNHSNEEKVAPKSLKATGTESTKLSSIRFSEKANKFHQRFSNAPNASQTAIHRKHNSSSLESNDFPLDDDESKEKKNNRETTIILPTKISSATLLTSCSSTQTTPQGKTKTKVPGEDSSPQSQSKGLSVQRDNNRKCGDMSSTGSRSANSKPDEMTSLLDEIEFELNSSCVAPDVSSVTDELISSGCNSQLVGKAQDSVENIHVAVDQSETYHDVHDENNQFNDSSSDEGSIEPTFSSLNIGNRIRLEQKIRDDKDEKIENIHGEPNVNGNNEHTPLSQSVTEFLDPSDLDQPAAESFPQPCTSQLNRGPSSVDSVKQPDNDAIIGPGHTQASDPRNASPTVEDDVAELLSDLESDANHFSTQQIMRKMDKAPRTYESDRVEQDSENDANNFGQKISNSPDRGATPKKDRNGSKSDESDNIDETNSTNDGSSNSIPPKPNSYTENQAYFDLIHSIPLPDGDFLSVDGDDAVAYRIGFELCHRAIFSIWPAFDADIQNERLNSKNPDRVVWSALQYSNVAKGLSNINKWKFPSEEKGVEECEEPPRIESSTSNNDIDNDNKTLSNRPDPIILVPLSFVYEAWTCILGLNSLDVQSDFKSINAGAKCGKMYTWVLSNCTNLVAIDGVLIDTPSLSYETNLSENNITVCNYVTYVLRKVRLVELYVADVCQESVSSTSKSDFYIGLERTFFNDFVENPTALLLDEYLLCKCQEILSNSVCPKLTNYLDNGKSHSFPEPDQINHSFIWYCCRHSIQHLLANGNLDKAHAVLTNENFIRLRLQNNGLLHGTFEHCRDCAKLTIIFLKRYDSWRSNELQTADERNNGICGLSSFPMEDYENKKTESSDAPDILAWKESYFKVLCVISTILREKAGEVSLKKSTMIAETSEKNTTEYHLRSLKEEIGEAFQIVGESIGDIDSDTYRIEELENYEEALQLKTEAFGGDQNDASIADTLYAMGCHHQRFNHFSFAQKCYEQALRIYKFTLGYKHFSVARVLHNIGIMYAYKDERDIAMKCFKKSLSIRISASELGDADLSVADSLCWMGKIHRENEEYFDARECFMVAHRTKSAILGTHHPECADVLHNIGVVCDDLNLYPQSLSCYSQALTIRRANVTDVYDVTGINDVCETLNCIANVYRTTGERQKALQFYQQSLKRRVRIVSAVLSGRDQISPLLRTYEDVISLLKLEVSESTEKSDILGQIGKLLLEMGKLYDIRLCKHSKAMLYYQRALEVFKEMKNYKRIGDTLSFMGGVHAKKRSHKKALKCFKDSLVLRKIGSKEETADTAETYHNIGNCEAKLGLFEDCLHSYCEALKIKKKIYPSDMHSLSTAKTEHCMGLALLQLGNVNEALGFFMPAMEVRQKVLGSEHLDFAFSLHNVGRVYFHQGRIDDAIVCLEEALRIKKSKLDKGHQSLAETEHVLASLYIQKEDIATAIPLLKSALSTYKGKKDCDIMKSDVFDLLGKAYSMIGINEDAILSYKHSLKIKRAVLGLDDVACANVLMEIGKLRASTGDLNEALIAFKEVKRIHKEVYGKEHLRNADLLIQVGLIQEKIDNDDMAFRCYTESLRLRQLLLSKNHFEIAEALALVGKIHQKRAEYFKSIYLFQEAIGIYRDPNNKKMMKECADVCRLLGMSQMEISDTDNALSSFERSLKLRERVFGKDSEEWAEVAYDIGVAKARIGLHDEAVELIESFVAMKRTSDKADDKNLSNALFQLGLLKSRKRNMDEALSLLQESLNIRRMQDENELEVSEVLFQIGCIHEVKRDYLESLVCLEESLQLRQSIVGDDEISGDTMLKIGEVHRIRQEFDLAIESLTKALETFKSTVGEEHLSVANTLHNLGYVCDAKHDYREAMKFHKQGLNIRKINLGSNHVSVASSLDDIAGIYQKVSEYEKALKCLEESLRIRKLQKDCDGMEIATNLFGMGIVYAANNDNDRAMECYHSSLEISCQVGSNPKLEAQALHQIGCVYATLFNYRDALQNWRTSLSKYREAGLDDDHYMVACTLGNIEMAENVLAGN